MGFLDFAVGLVSKACEFISTIGSGLGGFAKTALEIVGKLPIPGLDIVNVITTIANIIHNIIEFLGIKSEDSAEVLGAKAQQCEKTIDDFDSVEDYIKYLKEEITLDMDKFEALSKEERLGCQAMGLTLETKAIEEKMEVKIPEEGWAMMAKMDAAGVAVEAKDVVEIIKSLKEQGITDLGDVIDYLEGKGDSDRVKTGRALLAALGEGGETKMLEALDASRKYEEV